MGVTSTKLYMQVEAGVAPFEFKQFRVAYDRCSTGPSTDAVVLGAWAECKKAERILDVGCGSGLIALMLAQRNAAAEIVGVEIDARAAEQAKENALLSPWADRVSVEHTDIQSYARNTDERYDLIVCNPPFFSGGNLSSGTSRATLRSTTKLPHGDLLGAFRTLLTDTGSGVVVLPYIEGLRFCELARSYNLYPVRILQIRPEDERPIERLVIQLDRKRMEPIRYDMPMRYEGGEAHRQFKRLTKAFYTSF